MALLNFKGDTYTKIEKLEQQNQYNKDIIEDLKTFFDKLKGQKDASSIVKQNDLLEILIYEKYFLKYILIHFSLVFEHLFKKEYLHLGGVKLKNCYILDINTEEILLDLKETQKNKKNRKYYNNTYLFDEICYHSKQMYNSYIEENGMKSTSQESEYRFVKFECSSTYPRLLFIIKFFPILKGLAIIHLYYQKKLSHNNNDTQITPQNQLYCKEVDILFGSSIRNNPNYDFRYKEPKKLSNIGKFIDEFYFTPRKSDLFRDPSHNKEFKYFSYETINAINEMHEDENNDDIDSLFKNVEKNLHDQFIKYKEKKVKKEENNTLSSISSFESIEQVLRLNKDLVFNDLFKDEINKQTNKATNEERKNTNTNTNTNANDSLRKLQLNQESIDEYINDSESQQKLIPKEMRASMQSMSLSNVEFISKDFGMSSKKIQDNFSLLSDVKAKETEIEKEKEKSKERLALLNDNNIMEQNDINNKDQPDILNINIEKEGKIKDIDNNEKEGEIPISELIDMSSHLDHFIEETKVNLNQKENNDLNNSNVKEMEEKLLKKIGQNTDKKNFELITSRAQENKQNK